jgi:hypothetical protein
LSKLLPNNASQNGYRKYIVRHELPLDGVSAEHVSVGFRAA